MVLWQSWGSNLEPWAGASKSRVHCHCALRVIMWRCVVLSAVSSLDGPQEVQICRVDCPGLLSKSGMGRAVLEARCHPALSLRLPPQGQLRKGFPGKQEADLKEVSKISACIPAFLPPDPSPPHRGILNTPVSE